MNVCDETSAPIASMLPKCSLPYQPQEDNGTSCERDEHENPGSSDWPAGASTLLLTPWKMQILLVMVPITDTHQISDSGRPNLLILGNNHVCADSCLDERSLSELKYNSFISQGFNASFVPPVHLIGCASRVWFLSLVSVCKNQYPLTASEPSSPSKCPLRI